jgi:hypothetical protein
MVQQVSYFHADNDPNTRFNTHEEAATHERRMTVAIDLKEFAFSEYGRACQFSELLDSHWHDLAARVILKSQEQNGP